MYEEQEEWEDCEDELLYMKWVEDEEYRIQTEWEEWVNSSGHTD